MIFYEVGGAIRDEFWGLNSKDVDYAVEADSFEDMKTTLSDMGFTFYVVSPEYFTIRALAPTGSKLGKKSPVVDFVLCRKDGPSEDGRRPLYVEPGTIIDDLARRDFTINALARNVDNGTILDPHNGIADIKNRVLRFVGDPMERIREDGLRVLRAMRFIVTKKLIPTFDTLDALRSDTAIEMILSVSVERIREELKKMFEYDTPTSLDILATYSKEFKEAVFRDGLHLEPTLKHI